MRIFAKNKVIAIIMVIILMLEKIFFGLNPFSWLSTFLQCVQKKMV